MKEEQIIQEAIARFQELTGIPMKEVPWGTLSKDKKMVMDTRVRLKAGKETIEFKVEARNELRQAHLSEILERAGQRKKEAWLVVSQYIPKPLKEELKKNGINYLEASGNSFIRHGGIFFYINDQTVTPIRMPEQGRLWKPSGLKFLFVVIRNPDLLNTPYRELARAAQIALGNIGPFIEELKKEGYVKTGRAGELMLDHQDQLQKKWTEAFASVLRPKLKLGRFRFLGPKKLQEWDQLPTGHFRWGGEAAGALLTQYLKPEKLTMYTAFPKLQLMQELKLVPDEDGPVELMEIFWEETEGGISPNTPQTVPPLLAYAELATSLDSRNRETAQRIKEVYLEH